MVAKSIEPTKRFSDRAEYYAKSRPLYPKEVLTVLKSKASFDRSKVVADIGSGTGILTKLFLDNGNTVYGVEPNIDMRMVAESNLIAYENFESVEGMAERTTLPPKSIDLITVGQAFHWFDLGKTKKEFKRILKKGGYVAILYYSRSEKTELSKDYEKIVKKYGRNFARVRETDGRVFGRFFGKDKYKKYEFWAASVRRLDLDGFISRFLSASYMPKSSERSYKPMIRDIKRIFDKNEKNGVVSMSYDVVLYLGKL